MSHFQSIPTHVKQAFERIPQPHRGKVLQAREMILEVAEADPRIGTIEECLRWGEPAYITTRNKTGSTIRLGLERTSGLPALFFDCKTTLVEEFRQAFGTALRYSKNRAVILDADDAEAVASLKTCIAAALTYHRRT